MPGGRIGVFLVETCPIEMCEPRTGEEGHIFTLVMEWT